MASHQIAIAKASFSAGLLRPDPTSVPRDDIAAFHSSLDRVLSHCSPANVQTCKAWLLQFVASSSNRVGGLAKYLVTLAGSFNDPVGAKPKPSAKRRRLHILYLLNDLFHHSKYHLDTAAVFSIVSGTLQPYMVDLLGHAAAYDRPKHPRHHQRLDDLLDVWSEHGYFSSELLYKLREVVKNAAAAGAPPPSSHDALADEGNATQRLSGRDVPFVMPLTHGDTSTPYYDLPAGNMIPHIIPNSTIPLRPETIKPLQFLAGPADGALVDALKLFLNDVDQIYGTEELIKGDGNVDVDELGQRITRDETNGDILDGETYYGWSREFCQQMKKRAPGGDQSPSRGGAAAQNDNKRRYSDSSMSDRSRRSDSRSRSRSRPGRHYGARSRSRSPRQSRSRSRKRSYSPRQPSPPRFPPPHQSSHPPPPSSLQYGAPYGHSNTGLPFPMPPQYPVAPPQYPGASSQYAGAPSQYAGTPSQYPGAWPPAPPSQLQGMPFAFPPSFPIPPPMPMPSAQAHGQPDGQPLPRGRLHFPPPHSGGQHGNSWGQSEGRNWQ